MTRYPRTPDPGTAACPAKNLTAVPGLPNQPDNYSGRTPMVGTTSPQSPPARPSYAEIGALMARKPVRAAAKNEREFQAARVSWLFEMADALGGAGLDEDADSVREAALRLVQTAVSELAGGEA
jgi:hypothetical protein